MSIIIKGGASSNLANVDASGNLMVNVPTALTQSGYVSLVAEIDNGSIVGPKLQRTLDASQDSRLRVGIDKITWMDTFNHTILNTSKYLGITSVQTITVAGGFLNLNAGNSVTSTNVSRVQTYKTFSLMSTYPLYVAMRAKFSATLQSNSVIEFGLGYATTTSTPTDGVFFRAINGQLNGVINNNGFETSVNNIFTPSVGVVNNYQIVIGTNKVEFYVDDILRGTITTPSSLGATSLSNSLPILLRNYNSGTVATAVQLQVGEMSVTNADMETTKDWPTTMSENGQNAISAPDGQTVAQTANIVNITAPVSATLSNTAAGYTTLGGQFQFAAVAGSETDYALFAYTNPAGTSAIPGKTLVITGIRIDTFNMGAAVATTPTTLQWMVGIGGTAVSLLTVDSATAGTRAARRLSLGVQSLPVGTAIGGNSDRAIDVEFSTPLMVEQSTILHVILKIPVATATASQIIRGTILINGYFD